MDIVMPQLDGIEAISRIKAAQPQVQVVALTSFIEEDKVLAALEAGASGFILKDAEADDVAAAIRAAHHDEVHLDPAAARILAKGMRARSEGQPVEALTERELEVLSLVGRGRSNKEIATDLGITERTARTHVSNILGKLDLQSRTQAALYAVERKLVYD
jgi:DNA-binding NarL/FixJ family response regulator